MKLNRKWMLLVALVLSVAMATTGTLAYLTDEDKDVNTMTLGKVEIVQNEQERDEDGELQPFTPNKPALPAVYKEIQWDDERVTVGDTGYLVFADDMKNVVDKIVTVTNTGKNDAYIRTIIAIEEPAGMYEHAIHINVNDDDSIRTMGWENVEINGVRYAIAAFTYNEKLPAGETSAPSLMQVFLDKQVDNEDVEKLGDTWEILVLSQAVQADGFEEWGAEEALNEAFNNGEKLTATKAAEWFDGWNNWEENGEVGSPGDKNETNNPPLILPETSWENNASDRNFAAEETIEIGTAEDLAAFAKAVNDDNQSFSGKTVKLTADIDLKNHLWTPIGQTGHNTFNGVFDGQNYTIKNLYVVSDDQTGAHYSSGLFGWVESPSADHGHIKNVKIDGAYVSGHHNCGALVGYITQQTALVENCHVKNAQIICTYANGDADGDKAGALIGNATVATPVKDCTAKSSTVSAGRDAGAVAGAGNEANFTGCSFENVTVTSNGTGSGANIREETIGRLLK